MTLAWADLNCFGEYLQESGFEAAFGGDEGEYGIREHVKVTSDARWTFEARGMEGCRIRISVFRRREYAEELTGGTMWISQRESSWHGRYRGWTVSALCVIVGI